MVPVNFIPVLRRYLLLFYVHLLPIPQPLEFSTVSNETIKILSIRSMIVESMFVCTVEFTI